MTAARGTVVGALPCRSSQTYSFGVHLLGAVAIAVAFANAIGQAAPQQGTQDSLGAQQACAAQAKIYLRERQGELDQMTSSDKTGRWRITLVQPRDLPENHYNRRLQRCLAAVATLENDPLGDLTVKLTHDEIVDPFEKTTLVSCHYQPLPVHLIDKRTGKEVISPPWQGCYDEEHSGVQHLLTIEVGRTLMGGLMRE